MGGLALQARIRAERETLRQLVTDLWARRGAASEGGGYVVALDAELCAASGRLWGTVNHEAITLISSALFVGLWASALWDVVSDLVRARKATH